MVTYNLHYRKSLKSGQMILMDVEPVPALINQDHHRVIVAEEITVNPAEVQLLFREVRGTSTCAELALQKPSLLPVSQLRSFLELFEKRKSERTRFVPSSTWDKFRDEVGDHMAEDDARRKVLSIIMKNYGNQLDQRLGLNNIVVNRIAKALDGLVTSSIEIQGSAGRVVGELLEIWCLNYLYKSRWDEETINGVCAAIDLVQCPEHVRQTWWAHLARMLDTGSPHWKAQLKAIDLAEVLLAKLWCFSSRSLLVPANIPNRFAVEVRRQKL